MTAAPSVPTAGDSSAGTRSRGRFGAYLGLTKPRIIELLLVTTVPTMFLAAGGFPPVGVMIATLVGGALAAGGANTLNSFIDRDIDAKMARTGHRPLVTGEVSPRAALVFGWVLSVLSVVWLAFTTNLLSAFLAAGAIAFYVLIYTMGLKRRTPQNIVWGGAAGCFPVLIGWAAVTGSLSWAPWVMFAIIFFWTPPHTWALAMKYKEDYRAAGVPMLPVVATERQVTKQVVIYTWLTVAATLALIPAAGWLYAAVAVLSGAWFLTLAHRLHAGVGRGEAVKPLRLFLHSNNYLSAVFVALAVDSVIPIPLLF